MGVGYAPYWGSYWGYWGPRYRPWWYWPYAWPYGGYAYSPWWYGSPSYGTYSDSLSIGIGLGSWRHGLGLGVSYTFATAPACSPYSSTLVCSDLAGVSTYSPLVLSQPSVVVQEPPVIASATLPRAATPEELRSSSDRELGDTYIKLNDAGNAIRVYQHHLEKFPGDAGAERAVGLAMIMDRRPEEGFRAIERAYRIDTGLAGVPISAQGFADQYTFRRVVDEATGAASKADTASAWLTVAVLMQADGKADSARNALARAKAAGLDPAVYSAMSGNIPQ